MNATADDVLEFWFGPVPEVTSDYLEPRTALWFAGAPETGAEVRSRLGDLVAATPRVASSPPGRPSRAAAWRSSCSSTSSR